MPFQQATERDIFHQRDGRITVDALKQRPAHENALVASRDAADVYKRQYLDYQNARQMDRATSQAIETLRFEDIGYEQACGRNPVNGLLWVARRKRLRAETLDLRNSGDTAGSRDQVVGYGAYAFH